jgi:hypothetical protein
MMPILFWLPLIYVSALLELAASGTDNRSRAHLATVSGDMTDAKSSFAEYPRQGMVCLALTSRPITLTCEDSGL